MLAIPIRESDFVCELRAARASRHERVRPAAARAVARLGAPLRAPLGELLRSPLPSSPAAHHVLAGPSYCSSSLTEPSGSRRSQSGHSACQLKKTVKRGRYLGSY